MDQKSLLDFIKTKQIEGIDDNQIRQLLLQAGWQMDVINHAFDSKKEVIRSMNPILDYKKQPLRKIVMVGLPIIGFLLLCLAALFLKI